MILLSSAALAVCGRSGGTQPGPARTENPSPPPGESSGFFARVARPGPFPLGSTTSAQPASSPGAAHSTPNSGTNQEPCPGWKVNAVGRALGSLEQYCTAFAPCPSTLRSAGELDFFGALPTVEAFATGIILTYGSPRDGRRFAFTLHGEFVGASIWQETTFGACGKRAIEYTGGTIPEPAEADQVRSCGYVPGRDLRTSTACRCERNLDRPPLVGLDRGPTLRLSLDCLYELGAVGNFCQQTLASQQEMPDAQPSSPGCGWTAISSPLMGTDCVYARSGRLVEMRLGKRYVSTGFDKPCRP